MKKLIIITLLAMLAFHASGQTSDSLYQKIMKIEASQKKIQLNLVKSHKQFSAGTMFLAGGAVTTTVAILLMDKGLQNENTVSRAKINPVLLGVGGGLMTIGTVLQIDSHKWIGKAGRRRK